MSPSATRATTHSTFYRVVAPAPLVVTGTLALELVQGPEHSLGTRDSLLGLVARAGPGDLVSVEQLYEQSSTGVGNATFPTPSALAIPV